MLEAMSGPSGEDRSVRDDAYISESLAAQKQYYELRAPEYGSWTKPSDRVGRSLFPSELAEPAIADLRPYGDVLELACGPGPLFTSELARHATTVTAVDASRTTLRLNQMRVANPKVTYVEADLFDWSPSRTYDFVFFGHWLSHIPPTRFDAFWDLVRRCIGDHGRVGFIDEDDRAASLESRPSRHAWMARRTLSDGRHFDIVKVFWSRDDLERRLRSLGWDIRVQRMAEPFMVGAGQPEPG
jgi:demethylmenaquinone methyltransferase/2-methoxy-6-polyprenyl-1,4-benzoquinol methylase